jgi:hypothetical protein
MLRYHALLDLVVQLVSRLLECRVTVLGPQAIETAAAAFVFMALE